jgi:transposase-like protein
MAEDYPKTMLELESRFSDEAACREYLTALRWPEGFVCPRCAASKSLEIRRDLWRCLSCRKEVSVTAGTVFQDSKLPLTLWFRAMWQITSQKNGVSAIGLQRVLGLGSYKTAWTVMHKLRRAMVRPGRERLHGIVEVDEAYWGGEEEDVSGRQTYDKALIAVAAEADGPKIGRIRLRHIPDCTRKTLHGFITEAIEPASTVQTDGWQAYRELQGYVHQPSIQSRSTPDEPHLLPRVHRVISLLKRWLMGTHQGAVSSAYLQDYLDEFTFRFNRRTSSSRGKLFYRLAQQAVQTAPTTYDNLGDHNL